MAAFPSGPVNGQQATVNGILYTYDSGTKSWTRVQGVAGNITSTGTIAASALATGTLNANGTATVNALTSNGAVTGTTGTFTTSTTTSALNTGTLNANSTATVNALTSNGAIIGTTGTFGSGVITTTLNANANITVTNLTVNTNATISSNIVASNYVISGTGIFYSNGTAFSSGGSGNITGTGIFWPNGSPAVYNTSFWVQNQDYGLTANTADYGNTLGLISDTVDTVYDEGTLLNSSAVDGNSIVDYTITGTKFSNSIAISTTGDISAGNISSGNLSTTSNISVGNLSATGSITVTANVTATSNIRANGSFIFADGTSQATAAVGVPTGTVAYFAANTTPSGWLRCDGSTISRTTYSSLYSFIGTTFGSGDGSTTFGLPDLRGEFLRGFDNGRGIDSGRAFGSFQEATGHTTGGRADQPLENYENAYSTTSNTNGPSSYQYGQGYTFGRSRPRNIALLACIKY